MLYLRIIVVLFFVFVRCLYALDLNYREAYEAYLQEDYERAVLLFQKHIKTNKDPNAFFYLALSYFSLGEYSNAKKYALLAGQLDPQMAILNKNDYFQFLTDIQDHILEKELLGSDKTNYVVYVLYVVLVVIVFGGLIFIRKYLKRKPRKLNAQLLSLIKLLNEEFHYLKQEIVVHSPLESDDLACRFVELEERCMFLNDRLEHCKSHGCDQQSFQHEIEVTRELIRNYIQVTFKKNDAGKELQS